MGKKRIDPMPGQVVVKLLENQEMMYGNIIVPDTGKEKAELATVVDFSPTYNYHTDRLVYSKLKIGDIVIIPKMGIQSVTLDNEEFYVCQENQLAGIIKEENE